MGGRYKAPNLGAHVIAPAECLALFSATEKAPDMEDTYLLILFKWGMAKQPMSMAWNVVG